MERLFLKKLIKYESLEKIILDICNDIDKINSLGSVDNLFLNSDSGIEELLMGVEKGKKYNNKEDKINSLDSVANLLLNFDFNTEELLIEVDKYNNKSDNIMKELLTEVYVEEDSNKLGNTIKDFLSEKNNNIKEKSIFIKF